MRNHLCFVNTGLASNTDRLPYIDGGLHSGIKGIFS